MAEKRRRNLPVMGKLVVGMLSPGRRFFGMAEAALERQFGPIDFRSRVLPFEETDYYEKEMGKGILRKFVSMKAPVRPEDLGKAKKITGTIENEFRDREGNRKINLDPGYMRLSKFVLATTKDYSHRIYLGAGIWGEVTLYFRDGSFRPYPWTYPDYRTAGYIEILNHIREVLKSEAAQGASTG